MEGKTDNMTNMTPTELATIVMAIVIVLQLIILFFQFLLFRKQTQANRLSALREIFFYHHSEEMRNLREEVSAKLLVVLASNQNPLDARGEEGVQLRHKTEVLLNYYEFLGSLLRYHLVDREIIDMVHNSAIRIWSIVEPKLDLIRPKDRRGPDYASDFKYLVEFCKKYRKSKTFRKKCTLYGTGGTEKIE